MPLQQPVIADRQVPEQGQPIHFAPFFFLRIIYSAAEPIMSAITRSVIAVAIIVFIAYFTVFLLFIIPIVRIAPAITRTAARPQTAAVTLSDAASVIRVPTVYTK